MTGAVRLFLAAAVVASICAVFINVRRRRMTATAVCFLLAVILFCAAAVTP